jgi:hypothetical protein
LFRLYDYKKLNFINNDLKNTILLIQMDIFATSHPISKEKSEGEGYFLEKDGSYHVFLNYGFNGDFANGTYMIENDIIIFQTKLNNFKENHSKHIFKFEIEDFPEKKQVFNGREMLEYSQILKLDRDFYDIFSEENTSPETHNRYEDKELFYFINPIEIEYDVKAEYYRLKIIEFRKYFNLEELSNDDLNKLVEFNKENEFKRACLFVFDLENIGTNNDNLFCALYYYVIPYTIIEVKKNGERNLYSTYKSGYYEFDSIDYDDKEPAERIIDYEKEYSEEELNFILNFNPYNFNLEELKIQRTIFSYMHSFKDEVFDKNNISNLIQLSKNEPYNGIVLIDNENKQLIMYPNMWYVKFDKNNNKYKVYDFFAKKESETKLEEIYQMRGNGSKTTIIGIQANLDNNNIESGYLNI